VTRHDHLLHTTLSRRTLAGGIALAATMRPLARTSARQATPATPPGWLAGPALPAARSELPATVLDGLIYIAGGFGTETRFSRFDPVAETWEDLAELPAPRHHLGLTSLDGAIYIVGGHDLENVGADTFWRYDPAADVWEDGPSLPQGPRGALGCAALDGAIYAVGGAIALGAEANGDVTRYDPSADAWETLPPLTIPREHLAVAASTTGIHAIGGRSSIDVPPELAGAHERFDPATGVWEARAALPVPRSGMGVASDGERIIVLGGEGERGLYADANAYDPDTDTWIALPDLPGGRHGVAAAIVADRLYAIGGSTLAWSVQNVPGVDVLDLVG